MANSAPLEPATGVADESAWAGVVFTASTGHEALRRICSATLSERRGWGSTAPSFGVLLDTMLYNQILARRA